MERNIDNIPDVLRPVESDNPMKMWLVEHVGNKFNPEDGEVNVEMVVQAMAEEFPEFLLAVAEENFIRGYKQALTDVDNVEKPNA